MYAIETSGITKKYKDVTAVDNLDLKIKDGELFALLGVNGAGKTTLIKMLSCLTSPSAGDALIKGKSIIRDSIEVKKAIGVSPQESAVAPNLSVKENLELICELHGFRKERCAEKIKELSEAFKLSEILNKRASKLSGGWQRRVSIAMALIGEPSVLFLDEPTQGLDVIARSELWDVIRALKTKCTVILTTHYMEEAEALSDRIGIMKDGRLLKVGTTEEITRESGENNFENAFISIVREVKR
jgi:ABC-2 type transport system ATP-binding protein